VAGSPINPRTGRHQLVVVVCSEKHIAIVKNLLCTAEAVNTDRDLIVVVTIDLAAKNALSGLDWNTIFVDLTALDPGYYDFRRVYLVLAEALLLLGAEVTLLDGDVLVLQEPGKSLADAIVGVDIVGSYDFPWILCVTDNINVGILTVAPTMIGIELIREWMRVFTRVKDPGHPSYQLSLREVLKRGPAPMTHNFSTIDWQCSAESAIRQPGVIRARLMSFYVWATAAWIDATFTAGALANKVDGPTFIHLADPRGIDVKLKWIRELGFDYSSEKGCVSRTNRLFLDLAFQARIARHAGGRGRRPRRGRG
jgi:hypothetical protein